MATRTKQWGQLTPRQIARLDKDRTVVVLPLGTTGSLDPATRLSDDLRVLAGDAKEIVQGVNDAIDGPLAGITAIALPPVWSGIAPGPGQPGTIALRRATFARLVEDICSSLRQSEIKFVLLVTRDDELEAAAVALKDRLNRDNPRPWINVYNPTRRQPPFSAVGDACRKLCELLGCNPNNCPQ